MRLLAIAALPILLALVSSCIPVHAAGPQVLAVTLRHDPSGLCLSTLGAVTGDGAQLTLLPCEEKPHQVLLLTMDDNGLSHFAFKHSQKCLAVSEFSREDGASVSVWGCAVQDVNQQWELELNPSTKRVTLRNQNSRACMTVPAGTRQRGAAIIQKQCKFEDAGVRWEMRQVQ